MQNQSNLHNSLPNTALSYTNGVCSQVLVLVLHILKTLNSTCYPKLDIYANFRNFFSLNRQLSSLSGPTYSPNMLLVLPVKVMQLDPNCLRTPKIISNVICNLSAAVFIVEELEISIFTLSLVVYFRTESTLTQFTITFSQHLYKKVLSTVQLKPIFSALASKRSFLCGC